MDGKTAPVMSVPEYGRSRFEMSKNAAYAAAHRGDIPIIQIAGRLYVPIEKADRKFGFIGPDEVE